MNLQKPICWLPTRGQVLRVGSIVIALAALVMLLVVLIRLGYAHPWTGFGQSEVNQGVQPAKTLWDWLGLLIVPVVLAVGGYLFNSSQNRATQRASERRARADALQAYLDHMSDMLTPKKDQVSLSDERPPNSLILSVARARTVTLLARLSEGLDEDGGLDKRYVLQFLYEAQLIVSEDPSSDAILDLTETDFRGANLSGAPLSNVNLSAARLEKANLNLAYLPYANLVNTHLEKANLDGATLSGADLTSAHLEKANLKDADLGSATLTAADLTGASLRGARGVTREQLEQQTSLLEGATMPDGSKYAPMRAESPPASKNSD